mmetsp:Transcript_21571/g.59942  ORF Transcript_21571/g.59942 Transcript_21571/m.59942 type:complete len:297 (-) Transcript_21571:791-1681(-)
MDMWAFFVPRAGLLLVLDRISRSYKINGWGINKLVQRERVALFRRQLGGFDAFDAFLNALFFILHNFGIHSGRSVFVRRNTVQLGFGRRDTSLLFGVLLVLRRIKRILLASAHRLEMKVVRGCSVRVLGCFELFLQCRDMLHSPLLLVFPLFHLFLWRRRNERNGIGIRARARGRLGLLPLYLLLLLFWNTGWWRRRWRSCISEFFERHGNGKTVILSIQLLGIRRKSSCSSNVEGGDIHRRSMTVVNSRGCLFRVIRFHLVRFFDLVLLVDIVHSRFVVVVLGFRVTLVPRRLVH